MPIVIEVSVRDRRLRQRKHLLLGISVVGEVVVLALAGGAAQGAAILPDPSAAGSSAVEVAADPAGQAAAPAASKPSLTPTQGPSGPAFYVPPSPLPDGNPGDVIWYNHVRARNILGAAQVRGISMWQIMYLSTNTQGQPDAVTGLVMLPKGTTNPASLPLVGFAPGTQGLADKCAPSHQILGGTEYEMLPILGLLKRGWAVAVTDYEGLGTPGGHTYMIGRTQGAALIDAVRAARRVPQIGLSSETPLGLYGYSQGGGTSGWAAEMLPTYAPELAVQGIVAGGTPADLNAVAEVLDGHLGFPFLAASSDGLNTAYPELQLDSYLNATGRTSMEKGRQICVVRDLATFFGKSIDEFTTVNPLTTSPQWKARIAEQKLGKKAPTVPVFLAHGRQDEFIPIKQAEQLGRDWCALGAKVTWKTYFGEHLSTIFAMKGDAMDFLAAHFAGGSIQSSC
jgi:pimeloyl-ACP methyl ester carboxylesterase